MTRENAVVLVRYNIDVVLHILQILNYSAKDEIIVLDRSDENHLFILMFQKLFIYIN